MPERPLVRLIEHKALFFDLSIHVSCFNRIVPTSSIERGSNRVLITEIEESYSSGKPSRIRFRCSNVGTYSPIEVSSLPTFRT